MTKMVSGHVPLLHFWVLASSLVTAEVLRRDQGVPDTRAIVGRIFSLSMPKDAFRGTVERYELTEAGENNLPLWLQFDHTSHILHGVPGPSDSGQLFICIKAVGESTAAKDVFSIEVTEDSPTQSSCGYDKTETTTSIILDASLTDLHPSQKLRILQSVASQLNLPESKFQLLSLQRDESSFDPSAIRAGPGNALHRNTDGTRVQFVVGCSGEVAPENEAALSTLEKTASTGELSDAMGYLIIGWQVSGVPPFPVRERRNVTPFRATPVPKVHFTRWPTVTERVDESDTREVVPEVRIIPTMTSPYYGTRTFDHRHRHHHGEDHLRRENYFPTTEIFASPTYRYHTYPTTHHQTGGTPLPTPVLRPERPTSFVAPTRGYDIEDTSTALRIIPTVQSEDILSRWYIATTDFATVDIKPTRSRTTIEPTKHMPQTPNFKPTVNNRMKELSLIVGKMWSYTIPGDTFIDLEDGNTRDLKLMFMTSERTSLSSSSWIQFDPENQVIYALPLNDNIGKHEFVLEAMDSEGASTFDRVQLHVWKHPTIDAITHTFTMIVRYNKWQYPVGIDWQIEVLKRLARLFGDPDNSKLTVVSVTLDPVKLTWGNDSIPTDHCPTEEIQQLYDVMAIPDQHPTKEMKKIMQRDFRVQDISVKYHGTCIGIVTTPPPPMNLPPILSNPIQRINVTVGDIVNYKIPENTFNDLEDGSTRKLRLTLLTKENAPPSKSYWIQFDPVSQIIYGLPSESDIGHHDLSLNAMDSDGLVVPDTFVVHVSRLPRRKKPPVEFSVRFDHDYEAFASDTAKKILVAYKIARLYGDPGPQYIVVTNVTRGSVVYSWSNKTLTNDYCQKDKLYYLASQIVKNDGTPTENLIQVMEPEFTILSVVATPIGVCLGGEPPVFVNVSTTTTEQPTTPAELEPTMKTSTDQDIYITTIVPAIVIAVMLVIAAIVAYYFYLKKRSGKMTLDDRDFIGSGVPVVFAGELEEQKPDLGKAPAIMKNEKPPLSTDHLLNPFRRGTAGVHEGTSQTSVKSRERDVPPLRDRKDTSTLYKPPPPFTSSRESKGTRPKSTQAYRHTTYVPP